MKHAETRFIAGVWTGLIVLSGLVYSVRAAAGTLYNRRRHYRGHCHRPDMAEGGNNGDVGFPEYAIDVFLIFVAPSNFGRLPMGYRLLDWQQWDWRSTNLNLSGPMRPLIGGPLCRAALPAGLWWWLPAVRPGHRDRVESRGGNSYVGVRRLGRTGRILQFRHCRPPDRLVQLRGTGVGQAGARRQEQLFLRDTESCAHLPSQARCCCSPAARADRARSAT